jgi:CBS domain containing-hemolysin-like protein
MDRIVGMVFRRDLLEGSVDEETSQKTMRDLAMRLDFVPEGMKGPRLLAMFVRRRRHMAAVIDEYGGFEGIVTLEDVIECLLGAEIVDEHDEHKDLQELARTRAQERVGGGTAESAGAEDR